MSKDPQHVVIEQGTLILIDGKPFKVVIDDRGDLCGDEMRALDAAGITCPQAATDDPGRVTCMSIPVMQHRNMA